MALPFVEPLPASERDMSAPDDGIDLFDGLLELVVGVRRRQAKLKDQSVDLVDDEDDGQLLAERKSNCSLGVGHGLWVDELCPCIGKTRQDARPR